MDADLVARLSTGQGWELLQSLPEYDEGTAMALGQRLRGAGFEADLVAAALTQSRLRRRARAKFGRFAEGMLFTADGLEQATRLEVGARHAERFRSAGVRHVWDLGCGIGADAMAVAALDVQVTGVEADETTAAVARVNLRHWRSATVHGGRVEDTVLPRGQGAHRVGAWLDPARRTPGVADIHGRTRRTSRLEELSPSWDMVRTIAAQLPAAGAKLSPSFPHAQVPDGAEAQWTSYRGEVLECVLWWGEVVARPGRSALVLTADSASLVTQADAEAAAGQPASLKTLDQVAEWLYEPDRAVIRAGLTGALAAATGGTELDAGVGYVSAARAVDVPWASRYRVVEAMPFSIKALRAWVRDHDIGALTIKKRGTARDPDQVHRQLRPRGSRPATVVLTRIRQREVALVVTRA